MERIIIYLQSLPPHTARKLSWIIPAGVGVILLVIFAVPFFLPSEQVVDANGDAVAQVVGPLGSIWDSIGVAWKNMSETVSKIGK